MLLVLPRRLAIALALVVTCSAGLLLEARQAPSRAAAGTQPLAPVRVREDVIVIPTYPTGEPLEAPMFFAGRTYQGAQGPMYPYVLVDRLTDRLEPRQYRIIRLENEYIRIGILPELGGRIWEGIDKTNGYDFFYKNHVIKPALIGMVGAWISGGVEWNIPHHHRASSFMPVDTRIEEHADGSRTAWIGELELRHRMRWAVGLTLTPGRSTVDATVRLVNRTPVAHSFLYFANVAVHANEQYQVIFPPATEYGTHHAKRQFTTWPVSKQVYGGVDFTSGVDVSWWKNHPAPTSIFAWNEDDDFLAGYDHGRQAGTMHVADHQTVPGKKFFEWGPGSEGRYWDSLLTDADGPYLELMVGGYSDNQPDYTWIQPGETKQVTQTWYPIRDLGAPKNATRDAAVNLEPAAAGAVRVAFNATSVHRDAVVRLTAGGQVLVERRVTVGPATPFSEVVVVPDGTPPTSLRATLTGADRRELVGYQPQTVKGSPMPPPVVPPPAPKDIASNDELYLTGLRLEQFYSPAAEPEPYYQEAIRRDPGDWRAHNALAIGLIKRGLFADAAEHAEAAVARISRNYTSPKNGEAHYYLGVARLGLDDDAAAEPVLAKAAWDPAWRAAAYTRLAEIAARRHDWTAVVARTTTALAAATQNTRALVLHAIADLQLGRPGDALSAARGALAVDPLDGWALGVAREAQFAVEREETGAAGRGLVGSVVSLAMTDEARLETAVDYASIGLLEDALRVATDRPSPPPGDHDNAMLLYASADYAEQLGRAAEARAFAARARTAPSDYVFPFRVEHIALLERAITRDPADPRAPYYLGNLLMDLQPEAALRAWTTAARLDPHFGMVHRNLGWVAAQQRDRLPEAIASYERAIEADPGEPVFFYELDLLYERANTPPARRLALLEAHRQTLADRDDAMSRLVKVYVRQGEYGRALQILGSRQFHTWEGGTRFMVHDDYVDAHLLQGHALMRRRRPGEALGEYQAALDWPRNLGVGRPAHDPRAAEALFASGEAYAALRQPEKARAAWTRAADAFTTRFGDGTPGPWEAEPAHFAAARAFERLGHVARAAAIDRALVEAGRQRLGAAQQRDFFAKFGDRESDGARRAEAQFLIGLGRLGLGDGAAARDAFDEAAALDVSHVWAEYFRARR